jgi:DNA invertase Pin-like site-specific DNA recombinase
MRTAAFRIAERMLRSGASCDAVALRLGVHRSTVYRLRRAVGLPRLWYPVSDQERAAIQKMLLQDLSRREVARRTGRGVSTVSRIGTAVGLGPPVRRLRQPVRCPGCGFRILTVPCLICAAGGAEDPLAHARRVA